MKTALQALEESTTTVIHVPKAIADRVQNFALSLEASMLNQPVNFADVWECKRVDSSAIAIVGYRATTKTLRLVFVAGTIYDYFPVEERIFRNLLDCGSIGTGYREGIKGQFPSEKQSKKVADHFMIDFLENEAKTMITVPIVDQEIPF
jgi:hypothetical protein